jgi:ATP-binding cassette subfamily F protein uup
MALVSIRNLHHSFGGPIIFDDADFSIEPGERIGLVGRNGAGKSTLMAIVSGELKPESASIERKPAIRIGKLAQAVPSAEPGTVWEVAARGAGADGEEAILARRGEDVHDPNAAWSVVPRVDALLSQLDLDPDAEFATLSGGLKRRAMLARALAAQPDLLLLDEPTNHLDIESIEKLESFLLGSNVALLFVTHDRAFLGRVARKIAEVDRGRIRSWECDYSTFLKRRDEALANEAAENARFDKKMAEEEKWARQNVSARRTKSVARLRDLAVMRAERAKRRENPGTAKMVVAEAARTGKLVAELENVSFAYPDGRYVVRDLTTAVLRGDRIGLIGPNGCGKTTLINLILGNLQPTTGTVKIGTNVEAIHFDQQREQLNPDARVVDVIADGADRVTVGGQQRHVFGYLNDFLFTSDRAKTRVGLLSGGEQARLLLARLFLKPSNVLVLDEPTNDLDMETLELLEELVLLYPGTVIIVSHDRAFLDSVCTSVLAFEGDAHFGDYVGGYTDWLRQRSSPVYKAAAPAPVADKKPAAKSSSTKKISARERQELADLPAKLEAIEADLGMLNRRLGDPIVFRDASELSRVKAKITELEKAQEKAFARWEELEALAAASN